MSVAAPDRTTDTPEPATAAPRRRKSWRSYWPQYVAVAPFYLLFLVFGLFPIVFSIVLSFTDWDGMGEIQFVGLAQYQYLLTDTRFWNAVGNTFIIWFLSTIPMLFLALVIAFLLHSNIRFKGAYRVAYFIPNVTSMVAMTIVFGSVFSDSFGLVNSALTALGAEPVAWLSSDWGIKITISVMVIWRFTGYNAIIYLAGLQSIPTELYDAARVDGAEQLAHLHLDHHPAAAAGDPVHRDHLDHRWTEPVHRAAGAAGQQRRYRRGGHDDRALPVQPGVHPVRLRLRLGDRLGAVHPGGGVRRDQLAAAARTRRASGRQEAEGADAMTTTTLNHPGKATTGRRERHPGQARNLVARLVTHLCVLVGVLLSLFPFYWMLAMSTNTTADIFASPPKLTFGPHFVENVQNVLSNIDLVGAFVNTVIVAGALAILVMLFDSLAAFAFAKYDFPGKNVLFVILLATFLVPGSLSLVPSFVLMSAFGWIGDLRALIIPGAANAFGIFLLRQFASASIPDSLIESARIDGAGFFRTWWSVGVPMLRGGLAFLGIFTFIGAWNDYVWPLVVLVDPQRQTLQTALATLNSVYATDYGMIMAGAVISVVPLIGVFIIGSRHFIANIAAGALKG